MKNVAVSLSYDIGHSIIANKNTHTRKVECKLRLISGVCAEDRGKDWG